MIRQIPTLEDKEQILEMFTLLQNVIQEEEKVKDIFSIMMTECERLPTKRATEIGKYFSGFSMMIKKVSRITMNTIDFKALDI